MTLKYSFKIQKSGDKEFVPVQKNQRIKLAKQEFAGSKQVQSILEEMENLVGLENVKKLIFEIQAYIKIQRKRKDENLATDPLVLHMVFKGNPGTGKTTVARCIARLFKELDVLKKGQVIEIERADLVGEYIGHTALKTREQIQRALGGVLFIDEAYSLARGGEKDFGKEAIDCMVKAMEDYKDQLILILAGYRKEMEWFLQTNPGLRSRFPIHIEFPDYTITELMEIAELMLKQRQYRLTPEAKFLLKATIQKRILLGQENSGNARMIRNLIEKAIRLQAVRLIGIKQLSRDDLILITAEDIDEASQAI
ncbi:MAG: AAA family ATPase [Peptococcaceae bacterium]